MTEVSDSEERHHLHKLCAEALMNARIWPAQLFEALDNSGLIGRGVLVCSVDARGTPATEPQLQVPVAKEPGVSSFCKMLRSNVLARSANQDFQANLPLKAATGFQFVPTNIWKSEGESRFGLRIPRQSLKATCAFPIIARCTIPSNGLTATPDPGEPVLVQLTMRRPCTGARRNEEKNLYTAMGTEATRKEYNLQLLRVIGLDPLILREDPLFQLILNRISVVTDRWRSSEEHDKAHLLYEWGIATDLLQRDVTQLEHRLNNFIADNISALHHLRSIAHPETSSATANPADAFSEAHVPSENTGKQECGALRRPCPSCLADDSTDYRCECQPAKTMHDFTAFSQTSPSCIAFQDTVPTYRRNTNIQTSFRLAETSKSTHLRGNALAKRCGRVSDSFSLPNSTPMSVTTRVENLRKYPKESDLAMKQLREQLRRRMLEKDIGQQTEEEGVPTDSKVQRPPGSSRRYRRRMPQGDPKLARKIATAELLS